MEYITIDNGGKRKSRQFRIEVPMLTRPVIQQTKVIKGQKVYIGPEGQKYIAAAFDKMFGVIKGKIRKKNFRPDIVKVRHGNVVAI